MKKLNEHQRDGLTLFGVGLTSVGIGQLQQILTIKLVLMVVGCVLLIIGFSGIIKKK